MLFVLFVSMGRDYVSELRLRPLKAYCSSLHRNLYEYGDIWWNDTDRGPEELGENPVPEPLCPPQIPHGLTRVRTRASAVRDRRLTT
jgi:hypothetical protein